MTDAKNSTYEDPIFATTRYEALEPAKRDFQPWHRPRKQFVRRKQWLFHARALLDGRPPHEELRYLGLPGHDLLDIRLFHEAFCENRAIRFLGFNTGAETGAHAPDLRVSLQEVKGLANVNPQSRIVADDIRSLARKTSIGWKRATDAGPFDVVNLDLCDNVLGDEPKDYSIYDAIACLFALQNRRADPWLLLLTTRMDRITVDRALVDKLDAVMATNLDVCPDFAHEFETRLHDTGKVNRSAYVTTCHESDWVSVFCVALCKWVLKQSLACNMRLDVKSMMSYRVGHGADDDLVSLALLLTPSLQQLPDQAGIASSGRSLSECLLAARIPIQTARRCRVDDLLAENLPLATQMREETGALLTKARYSKRHYDAWAAALE